MKFHGRFSKQIVCFLLVIFLAIGVMPGIAATAEATPSFTDIAGHWAGEAIDFMVEGGFMQGTSATTFAPNLAFSRAMAVTILHRMAGEPETTSALTFSDVAPGRWYSDAVAWAHSSGVVQGVGGGRFAPTVNITRQEMATILHRFATVQGRDVTLTASVTMDFPDVNLINEWAENAMTWAVYNEIIRGTDLGTLNPRGNATRAEAATVLMRFAQQQPEPESCDDANCSCEPEPKPELPLPTADDFELTISMEETSLPQGENFIVHVELKNNSGQDLEIATYSLFSPHIPGQHWIFQSLVPPWPNFVFFRADSTFSRTIHLNWYYDLSPGVYELTIGTTFYIGWEQPADPENEPIPWKVPSNAQRIDIVSNTIELTVQPEPPTADDFELTISVEETSLPQGENFIVHVELKNNSGQDLKIATYSLFSPHIPGQHWIFERILPPWPNFVFFRADSTFSRTIHLNWYYDLSPGVYELTIGTRFYIGWEQPADPENEPIPWKVPSNAQRIDIVSNTIELTVQPDPSFYPWIIPGIVEVHLNGPHLGYSFVDLLGDFFDEFEVAEIRAWEWPNRSIEKNDTARIGEIFHFELRPETQEIVLEAIDFLLQNPHVRYALPQYLRVPPSLPSI